jgi:N-acetylneuraminate lyase
MTDFGGILPAVLTPFDADEKFMPGAFERLLDRVFRAGVHGIYVCGQTGEGLLQPVDQRKQVAEVAVRCTPPGRKVILHIGAYRTADAIELAKHASRCGAHAISSLPPIGSYSFAEIKAYYQAISAVSDLPLLVYYFPELCPSVTSADHIVELCSIPNVVGLKFTDFDLYKMASVKRHGAVIYNGRDEVLVAGLLMGADGGIGSFYNVVPGLFLKVYELAGADLWRQARAVQEQINELIRTVLRFPVFPAIRAILKWSGLDCGACLQPRRPLTETEEAELRRSIAQLSIAETTVQTAAL